MSVPAGARVRQSSNSFAQGRNQNCGNHITDVRTTRVSAPPGGASSFSLSWDGHSRNTRNSKGGYVQERMPECQGDNSRMHQHHDHEFSMNDRRAAQQWDYDEMSSCEIPRHMQRDVSTRRQSEHSYPRDMHEMRQGRPTPRQKYDDMSACERPPPLPRNTSCRQRECSHPREMLGMAQGGPMPHQGYEEMSNNVQRSSMVFGNRPRESSNTFAHGANQNCSNFISDVPTIRVAAPPGGRSSINLAWEEDSTNETNAGRAHGRVPSQQECNFERPQDAHRGASVRQSSNPRGMQGYTREENLYAPSHQEYDFQRPQDTRRGSYARQSSNPRAMQGYAQEENHYALSNQEDNFARPQDARRGSSVRQSSNPRGMQIFGQRPRESSNTYAHGSNQNCGNVISDVPSTRVVAPPGGRSSLNLAWNEDDSSTRNVGRVRGSSQTQQQCDRRTPQDSCTGSSIRQNSNARVMHAQRECSIYGTETPRNNMRECNTFGQRPHVPELHFASLDNGEPQEPRYISQPRCSARPSMYDDSHNAEPVDEVSRLKQMFKESKARMAKLSQQDDDFQYGQSSAPHMSTAQGKADFSRPWSGSTSASGARCNQACISDWESDNDDFPLGAEWSSFHQC